MREWRGRQRGAGTMVYSDGQSKEGWWADGSLVETRERDSEPEPGPEAPQAVFEPAVAVELAISLEPRKSIDLQRVTD